MFVVRLYCLLVFVHEINIFSANDVKVDLNNTQKQDDYNQLQTMLYDSANKNIEISELQKEVRDMRLEFESMKTKPCFTWADGNRMKNEQLTIKWLSNSIAEIRVEIAEMLRSLNSTAEFQRRQTFFSDISVLQNDVVSLRHDVESLKGNVAEYNAKLSMLAQDVDILKQVNSDTAAKMINFTQQIHAVSGDWMALSKTLRKRDRKVFKKMIVVNEHPLKMKVFTLPHETSTTIRKRKRHSRSFMADGEDGEQYTSTFRSTNFWLLQKRLENRVHRLEQQLAANMTSINSSSLQKRIDQLENFIHESNIRFRSQEKLHSSMLELLESVQSIEAKFDVVTPELKKEISKLEFAFSQITSNASVLQDNQNNQEQMIKAINNNLLTTQAKLADYMRDVIKTKDKLETVLSNNYSSLIYQQTILNTNKRKPNEDKLSLSDQTTYNNIAFSHLSAALQKQHTIGVEQLPKDCDNFDELPGIHLISPDNGAPILAFCERSAESNSRIYIVIQRRIKGETDFDRDWEDYASGFGNLSSEFWLGNEIIHRLTKNNDTMARIELQDVTGRKWYAQYDTFAVASRQQGFQLYVNGYRGNASNALEYQNGMKFSTRDSDHDNSVTNCAADYEGGWWFSHCQHTNLNGNYDLGLTWFDATANEWLSVISSKIMLAKRQNKYTTSN